MNKRILIVDDGEDIIKLLSARLRNQNFEVEGTTDGNEALSKVKQNPPDLIILDVMMPGMDGTEVAERIKQNKATAKIPIIFLTALQTKEEELTLGNQAGESIVFAKPYDFDALVLKIRELTA